MYIKIIKTMNNLEKINSICKKYRIINYDINSDGSIDVDFNVDLCNMKLKNIPLNFRKVNGNFNCSFNELKTLKGVPEYVGGVFNCSHNKILSLKYSPEYVKSDFFCNNNNLKSLKGIIKIIDGYFLCEHNFLKNLENGPEYVKYGYSCYDNELISLKGAPKTIYGNFDCNDNKLKTLKYSPQYIKGRLNCNNNFIYTFEWFPKYVKEFSCYGNPIYNIWILFKDLNYIELFNDVDIIREDKDNIYVVLDRLNYFLSVLNKPKVNRVKDYITI